MASSGPRLESDPRFESSLILNKILKSGPGRRWVEPLGVLARSNSLFGIATAPRLNCCRLTIHDSVLLFPGQGTALPDSDGSCTMCSRHQIYTDNSQSDRSRCMDAMTMNPSENSCALYKHMLAAASKSTSAESDVLREKCSCSKKGLCDNLSSTLELNIRVSTF